MSAKGTEWYADAMMAVAQLGGKARLQDVYAKVREARSARGATLGPNYKAWVRNAIQDNSRGRGKNVFEHVSRGVWALKGYTAAQRGVSSTP